MGFIYFGSKSIFDILQSQVLADGFHLIGAPFVVVQRLMHRGAAAAQRNSQSVESRARVGFYSNPEVGNTTFLRTTTHFPFLADVVQCLSQYLHSN